jgi:hypothetical protein
MSVPPYIATGAGRFCGSNRHITGSAGDRKAVWLRFIAAGVAAACGAHGGHVLNARTRFRQSVPRSRSGTEHWNKDELAAIITRDCMVGVANLRADSKPA